MMPMMDVTVRFEPLDEPATCCDADLRVTVVPVVEFLWNEARMPYVV